MHDAVTVLKHKGSTCKSMSSTQFRDGLKSTDLKTVQRTWSSTKTARDNETCIEFVMSRMQ